MAADDLRAQLAEQETAELLQLLGERNEPEWRPEVFRIAEEILVQRGVAPPPRAPSTLAQAERDPSRPATRLGATVHALVAGTTTTLLAPIAIFLIAFSEHRPADWLKTLMLWVMGVAAALAVSRLLLRQRLHLCRVVMVSVASVILVLALSDRTGSMWPPLLLGYIISTAASYLVAADRGAGV